MLCSSLNYNSPTPLCSFQCKNMSAPHKSSVYYPNTKNVCGSQYFFQLDAARNILYVNTYRIGSAQMYLLNLTIPDGALVKPVRIWPTFPYVDNLQFFLDSQPNPDWDPLGLRLVFYLRSNTPYVYTTNGTLVFRGPALNALNDGLGFYDSSFHWTRD